MNACLLRLSRPVKDDQVRKPPGWSRWLLCLLGLFPATAVPAAQSVTCLFAADGSSNLIRQYDLAGKEVRQITNDQFNFPTLLTFDSSTGSLITDINFTGPDAPDLVRFDLQGNILARNTSASIFGQQGGGIVDVVDSKRGTFFVTSTLNADIAEIDRNLQVIRRFSTGAIRGGTRILGAAASEDGSRLYVADANDSPGRGFIRIYDTSSGLQIARMTNAALAYPMFPRFADSGLLYVTDLGPQADQDNLLVFDQKGHLVRRFRTGTTIPGEFGRFEFLPNGRLAVLHSRDADSAIRVLTEAGGFVLQFVSPGRLLAIGVGTAPCVLTNEAEPFAIRSIVGGAEGNGPFTLTWDSCSSHLYEVQSSEESSATTGWTRRALMIGGDGTTTWTNTSPPATDHRFYRVRRFSFGGDEDGDGLSNLAEFNLGTDLRNADTDGDGIPDAWEVKYGLNPLNAEDAQADWDGDGYSNAQEYQGRTRPNVAYHYPAGLPANLAAWWKLDESAGTNVFDSSLNGHDGIVMGGNPAGAWTTGVLSNAAALGGPSGHWIEVPYHGSLAPTQALTLMGWVKPSGHGVLIGNGDAAGQGPGNYRLEFGPDEIEVQFSPAGDGSGPPLRLSPNWSTNDWHHLAVCYSGGTDVALFVDGEWRARQTVTGPFRPAPNPILIGFPGLTEPVAVDDVRLYNRALTADEIASPSRGNGLPARMLVGETAALRAFGASAGDACQWRVVSGQGLFTNTANLATDFRPAWCGGVTVQAAWTGPGGARTNLARTAVAFPGLSPISGWNEPYVQANNNCYNFATDIRTDTRAQPGGVGPWGYDCQDETRGAIADGLQAGVVLEDLCQTSGLPVGHIAALLVWPPYVDFHWARLEADGTWSHKPGNLPATTLDNSGQPITDPRTANFGLYQFCGFFWVGPNVHIH
jgi:hypothetical protein